MNDFLIKRVRQITALRRHLLQPPWYRGFRQTWAKAVDNIEIADRAHEALLEQDGDFLLTRDHETYASDLHTWWCRCPAYRQSAYHICKHLVRLYADSTSTQRNNIRPNFGSVWRQSSSPLLWVKGLHAEHSRHVRPLTRSGAYTSNRTFGEGELRLEPTMEDLDSEYDDDGCRGSRSPSPASSSQDSEEEEYDDETMLAAAEIREHGEAKLEAIAEMKEQLMAQVGFLERPGQYSPDDVHLDVFPQ